MKIISGDEFGILKLISTKNKSVQDTFGVLNAEHEVLSIIKSPLTTSMNSKRIMFSIGQQRKSGRYIKMNHLPSLHQY